MNTMRFAMITGLVFLAVGLLGFFPGLISPPPMGAPDLAVESGYGYLLGLFPVNVLHDLVHIAVGLWGLIAYRSVTGSMVFARGLAVFYGILAVMGLFPVLNTTFGLIPIFSHDVWLHAGTAAIAAYFGFSGTAEAVPIERLSRRAS
jgi:hypothetical protein